jgi:hypothetical protein
MTNSRPQELWTFHPEDERNTIIIESLEDLHIAAKVTVKVAGRDVLAGFFPGRLDFRGSQRGLWKRAPWMGGWNEGRLGLARLDCWMWRGCLG